MICLSQLITLHLHQLFLLREERAFTDLGLWALKFLQASASNIKNRYIFSMWDQHVEMYG